MAKGYWLVQADITDPERHAEYINTDHPVFARYRARIVVRWGELREAAATADGGGWCRMRRLEPEPLPPGTPAPDFTLPRSSYASVSLADLRGHRAILVFYPADWEPVSQQQLALHQDHLAEFSQLGAALLAVSTDHVWSHAAFARATGIRYPLLADAHPNGAVCREYGVYDEQAEASARALIVLDADGIIRWSQVYPAAINPGVGGIVAALKSTTSSQPSPDRVPQL